MPADFPSRSGGRYGVIGLKQTEHQKGIMDINLNLTPNETARLQEMLEHEWRTSINHLVSSVQAAPGGDWNQRAPKLAITVETDRMLILKLNKAIAVLDETLNAPAPKQPDNPEEQKPRTVAVQFDVSMYVHVDIDTGLPIKTIVQTPNVSSMDEVLTDCVRYGPGVRDTPHHPARWGRPATDEEKAEAIKILDNNCWPAPELVS